MPNLSIQIADALTVALNAGTFSAAFTARRLYVPNFELKDLKELQVSVVPSDLEEVLSSRAEDELTAGTCIGVQKKLANADNLAEIDDLMSLVDEIRLFSRRLVLESCGATCVKVESKPIYSPDHLDTQSLFTSLLLLHFRVVE